MLEVTINIYGAETFTVPLFNQNKSVQIIVYSVFYSLLSQQYCTPNV